MNWFRQLLPTCLIVFFVSSVSVAQTGFREGVLTYKADTIKRLEPYPAVYIISQVVVYKKADLIRIEIFRTNIYDKGDVSESIHIRNKKGAYTFIKSSDTTRLAATNFALFSSYEAEKLAEAKLNLQALPNVYTVAKVLQPVKWLGLPAERVTLTGNPVVEGLEAVITNAVDIPFAALFRSVRKLPGTPLQFINEDTGWLHRISAVSLKNQPVADSFFEIEASRKVMTLDEMMKEMADFK